MAKTDFLAKKLTLALLFAALALTLPGCRTDKPDTGALSVKYFYFNICGSCDPVGEFMDQFEQYTGISRYTPNLDIETFNVYVKSGEEAFEREMDRLGVAESQRLPPLLCLGDQVVPAGKIDDTLKGDDFADHLPDPASTIPVNASVVVCFYMPNCRDCEKAEHDTLSELPASVTVKGVLSPVHIMRISAASQEGVSRFRRYCEFYGVPENRQLTPLVFIGDEVLQGAAEISALPVKLEDGLGLSTLVLSAKAEDPAGLPAGYGWAGVLLAGLINGFGPCSISMTLMLLSVLATKRNWVYPVGLAYCLGKFAGFLLLGSVFYSLLDTLRLTAFQTVFKIVVSVFAAVMIVLNINDFIAEKSEHYGRVRLQLPASLRGWNHRLIKQISTISSTAWLVPAGILLGLLVAGGEFLCTGQIYVSVILMAAHSTGQTAGQAIWLLALYSLAVVLPLAVLVLIFGKGMQLFSLTEFFRKRSPAIKLIYALFFTAVLIIAILF